MKYSVVVNPWTDPKNFSQVPQFLSVYQLVCYSSKLASVFFTGLFMRQNSKLISGGDLWREVYGSMEFALSLYPYMCKIYLSAVSPNLSLVKPSFL
jgi:hypothetical protein